MDMTYAPFVFIISKKLKLLRDFLFVMSDHIHLIWQMQPLMNPKYVQLGFLNYTAQRIKHDLRKYHPELLSHRS